MTWFLGVKNEEFLLNVEYKKSKTMRIKIAF
jgi:hypothetical protein